MGKGKYRSKKVEDKEYGSFDSTAEYKFFKVLLEKQENGEITDLKRQEEFLLVPSFKDSYGNTVRKMVYVSDYTYKKDGKLHLVDVKGSLYNCTNEFKVKFKMCKYKYPEIIYEIVLCYEGTWYNVEDKKEKKVYMDKVKEKKLKKKGRK